MEPIFNAEAARRQAHIWDKSVRGFRQDHNFAFSLGISRGIWQFHKFGDWRNQDRPSKAYYSKFQYSFHLQIYRGFGYVLGSSAGYMQEIKVADDINPASGTCYPSVLVGLTLNISPAHRVVAGVEYYLQRWNALSKRDADLTPSADPTADINRDATISATASVFDWQIDWDYFYHLYWAVRVEAHLRHSYYIKPRKADDFPDVDSRIGKQENWYGLGIVHHLL